MAAEPAIPLHFYDRAGLTVLSLADLESLGPLITLADLYFDAGSATRAAGSHSIALVLEPWIVLAEDAARRQHLIALPDDAQRLIELGIARLPP